MIWCTCINFFLHPNHKEVDKKTWKQLIYQNELHVTCDLEFWVLWRSVREDDVEYFRPSFSNLSIRMGSSLIQDVYFCAQNCKICTSMMNVFIHLVICVMLFLPLFAPGSYACIQLQNLHMQKKCKVQHRWFWFSANEVKNLYNQRKRWLPNWLRSSSKDHWSWQNKWQKVSGRFYFVGWNSAPYRSFFVWYMFYKQLLPSRKKCSGISSQTFVLFCVMIWLPICI